MIAMFTVGPGVLERISKYMSCDIDRLINTGIKVDENNKAQSVKSTKEIILDILNALPGNKEYKNLQVYISTVIITNLLKLGIGKSKLIEAGLLVKKFCNISAKCFFDSFNRREVNKQLFVAEMIFFHIVRVKIKI